MNIINESRLTPIGFPTDNEKPDIMRRLWVGELFRLAGEIQGGQFIEAMADVHARLLALADSIKSELSQSDAAKVTGLWQDPK